MAKGKGKGRNSDRLQQLRRFKNSQPPEGSEEAHRLNERLRGQSLRASTAKQYATPEKLYLEVSSFPANAERIQLYIRALLALEPKLTANTIAQYVSSIKTLSEIRGDPPLTAQDEAQIKRALLGARKARESVGVNSKEAPVISDEALRGIASLETSIGSKADQLKVLTLMSIGTVSRLDETWNLRGKDIHSIQSPTQLRVTIDIWNPKTKSGLTKKVVDCGAKTRGAECGVIWCVAHELKERKEKLAYDELRFFPDICKGTYARELKKLLRAQYPHQYQLWDLNQVTGHSLRRTGTTRLSERNVSEEEIKASGAWKSDCWKIHATRAIAEKTKKQAGIIFGELP